MRAALIKMGYTPDVRTWHRFRATARTMLAERLDCEPLVIDPDADTQAILSRLERIGA